MKINNLAINVIGEEKEIDITLNDKFAKKIKNECLENNYDESICNQCLLISGIVHSQWFELRQPLIFGLSNYNQELLSEDFNIVMKVCLKLTIDAKIISNDSIVFFPKDINGRNKILLLI